MEKNLSSNCKNIPENKKKDKLNNSFFSYTDSKFFINSNNNSFDLKDTIDNKTLKKCKTKTKFEEVKKPINIKSKTSLKYKNNINNKNNEKLNINKIIKKIQDKNIKTLKNIQEGFIKELESIYKENLDKIEEIDEKYDKLIQENNIENNNNKLNLIMNDKNEELDDIEREFLLKKSICLCNYNENISNLKKDVINDINNESENIKKLIINYYIEKNKNNQTSNLFSNNINKLSNKKKF